MAELNGQKKRGRPLNGPFLWLMNLMLDEKSIESIITSLALHYNEFDDQEDKHVRQMLAHLNVAADFVDLALKRIDVDPDGAKRALKQASVSLRMARVEYRLSRLHDKLADDNVAAIDSANEQGKVHTHEAYVIAEAHLDFVPETTSTPLETAHE